MTGFSENGEDCYAVTLEVSVRSNRASVLTKWQFPLGLGLGCKYLLGHVLQERHAFG